MDKGNRMTRKEGEREGEKGGGMRRKVKCKRREGVRGVRWRGIKEVVHCVSKVGGSWKVEGVKVDLVWV